MQKRNRSMTISSWCHLGKDFSGSDEEIRTTMEQAASAGIRMLFPFVTENTKAFYDSRCTEDKDDRLSSLLAASKAFDVQVHPTVIPATDFNIAPQKTARMRYKSGAPGGIFCDGRPCMSWEYWHKAGLTIIDELLSNYDIDGIHLDVIRYQDTGQSLTWPCQCEQCKNGYRSFLGKETVSETDLKDSGKTVKFVDFRRSNINQLVNTSYNKTSNKGAAHSMAARADYFGAALIEGQDWVQWTRQGLFDFIAPMSYSTDREIHRNFIRTQVDLVDGNTRVLDGIGRLSSAGELSPKQMREQMEDGAECGADGVALFQFSALNEADFTEIKGFAENAGII
jgi:uncharacterized lipoprotein YddW (UPF0748 family)